MNIKPIWGASISSTDHPFVVLFVNDIRNLKLFHIEKAEKKLRRINIEECTDFSIVNGGFSF